MIAIDDADDPRLSDYVGLSDPRPPTARRARAGLLRRRVAPRRRGADAIVGGPSVRCSSRRRSTTRWPTALGALDAPVYVARPEILRRVVGFDLHRGAVASGDRWPLPSVASVLDGARSVAVLERITDHENLGGVFRNAAAFGIDAVLLDDESADPLYRRCVRVSIGHVLTVPWTRLASLDELRDRGFTLARAHARRRRAAARRARVARAARAAARHRGSGVVGRVARGRRRAGAHPMRPGVDSLERRDRGRDRVLRVLDREVRYRLSGSSDVIRPSTSSMRRVERDRLEQRPVVGDEQHRAREAVERLLELLDRGQVEVVGRLVEHEAVDAAGRERARARPGCAHPARVSRPGGVT